MKLDDAIAGGLTAPAATDKQSTALSHYRLYVLAFAVVYLVLFSLAIPTFVDEANSFNLATEKSLPHLFSALRAGADGSFPLYALVVYGWEKVFGASELSLRLNSGLFILLFIWHSSRRLERYFGPAAMALALLFLLSNKIFVYYALQARFYGLSFFLFSLCYWSSWDLLENKTVSLRCRLWHALMCGLLCLSHPLGLVYTFILGAIYLAFSALVKRLSLANCLAFLGGPAMFLVWLPSFMHQRLVNPTYAAGPPGWQKYWQFAFFDSKTLFLTLFAGLAVLGILHWAFKPAVSRDIGSGAKENEPEHPGNYWLVAYSLAFVICLNGMLALLDAVRIVPIYWMQAVRYLLVCWVAYAVIIGAIVAGTWRLLQESSKCYGIPVGRPLPFLVALVGLLLLMESHWGEWFRARASDVAYFSKISRIANERHLDVVCNSHWDAFYLTTRTPTAHVSYLLADNFPFKRYLLEMSKYYPRPAPICPPGSLHYTNEYIFLTDSPREGRIIDPMRPESNPPHGNAGNLTPGSSGSSSRTGP
jgi:hypothetical protein